MELTVKNLLKCESIEDIVKDSKKRSDAELLYEAEWDNEDLST